MTRRLTGIGVWGGLVVGPAVVVRPSVDVPAADLAGDQGSRLDAAVTAVRVELSDLATVATGRGAADAAAILDAQTLFLSDPAFIGAARDVIEARHVTAEVALTTVHADLAAAFAAIDDASLRARATDLGDVVDRLMRHLSGRPTQYFPATPFVLVAADLAPSVVAGLDPAVCLALVMDGGGPTGHAAIVARGLGISTVVAAAGLLDSVDDGAVLLVNGANGSVVVNPTNHEITIARQTGERRVPVGSSTSQSQPRPVHTRDGLAITIAANIDGVDSAMRAVAAGADGIGLFRTEALWLDRQTVPDEDEQRAMFRAVARVVGDRPIVVRTIDLGGDKVSPALRLPSEANPFLGLRGLRLCLRRPDLFVPHLRALLRATTDGRLAIMFPMVTSVDEVVASRALLTEARAALLAEGHPLGEPPLVGVMIETPAAALTVDLLAPHVDFISVGTNDLAQYTLAADRTNAAVAALADPLHPAHLRLLAGVASAAQAAGINCGMCGEMAADPVATDLLVGLGYTSLSMSPAAIPAAREGVGAVDSAAARELAAVALRLPDAAAVRSLLTTP